MSLNILITCLLKNVYIYCREKFYVNHFWELRVKVIKIKKVTNSLITTKLKIISLNKKKIEEDE